jgi:nucleotide-binding universal stress UspA family protein
MPTGMAGEKERGVRTWEAEMSGSRIRSILAATDLGEGSDDVLRTAAYLAREAAADLHVLHALHLDPARYGRPDDGASSFADRFRRAERALDEQLPRVLREDDRVASRHVVMRTPFLAITEAAEDLGCDLIVMGQHRRRGAGDCVRDATLDRVLNRVHVPCLVTSSAMVRPFRRVLIPIDVCDAPEVALAADLESLRIFSPRREAPRFEIHVVTVIPALMSDAGPLGTLGVEHRMRSLVRGVREPLERLGSTGTQAAVRTSDDVAGTIERVAAAVDADLVVFATHGRHSIARLLLGSISSPIARHTRRPLLLLPRALWESPSAALIPGERAGAHPACVPSSISPS